MHRNLSEHGTWKMVILQSMHDMKLILVLAPDLQSDGRWFLERKLVLQSCARFHELADQLN